MAIPRRHVIASGTAFVLTPGCLLDTFGSGSSGPPLEVENRCDSERSVTIEVRNRTEQSSEEYSLDLPRNETRTRTNVFEEGNEFTVTATLATGQSVTEDGTELDMSDVSGKTVFVAISCGDSPSVHVGVRFD